MLRKFKNFSILIGLIFLLSSCNTAKLFYDYGDFLASWELDRYFNLDGKQKDWIEQRIYFHLQWHKTEELPKYMILLRDVQKQGIDGVNMQELDQAFQRYNDLMSNSIHRLIPDAALFLSQIDEAQIAHLENAMLEENLEMEQEHADMTDQERFEERRENFWDQMEQWFGDFSEAQQVQINEWQTEWWQNRKPPHLTRLERRKEVQPRFLAMLRTSPEPEAVEKWLTDWSNNWRSESASQQKERDLRNKQRILKVDSILTAEQRQHAAMAVQEWIMVLDDLNPNH